MRPGDQPPRRLFDDRDDCAACIRCRVFVEDSAPDVQLSIGAYTLTKLKRCFSVFKAMVLDGRQAPGGGGGDSNSETQLQRRNFNGQQENSGGGVMKAGTENKGELGGQVRPTALNENCREATFRPMSKKKYGRGLLRTWDED